MGRDNSAESTGRPKRSKWSTPGDPVRDPAPPLASGLYLVATPIGNLGDMTLRALDTLRAVDLVACEDSRVTGKLMTHYGINVPLTAYHDHNAARVRPGLIDKLSGGARIALVSDGGTPLVSDPGYKLVAEAIEAGVAIIPIPGASAALAALTVAGLPTDRFLYAGFLPPKSAARRRALGELAAVPATLIFYEAPRRLAVTLGDMAAVLDDRQAAVAREMTKRFEETRRGTLAELARHYDTAGAPKGEAVIVVGPPHPAAPADDAAVDALLDEVLGSMSVRDAADQVAASTGRPRREIYARALALAKPSDTR